MGLEYTGTDPIRPSPNFARRDVYHIANVPRPVTLRPPTDCEGIVPSKKQESDMNMQDRENDRLSDDELDSVSGGTTHQPEPPFDFMKWILAHLPGGPNRK